MFKDKTENIFEEHVNQMIDSHQTDLLFEELIDQYEPAQLEKGQFIKGKIVQIDDNLILANVDAKRTAVVPPQDIARIDENKLEQISVDDEITLYVLRTPVGNEDLLVSINKGLEHQDWVDAKELLSDGELIKLEVIGHNKGGLTVSFGNIQGFVPISHVPQLRHTQNVQNLTSKKAKLVGTEISLKIIEVDRKRHRLILSAKDAHQEIRQQRLEELSQQVGEFVTGTVSNIVKFGAFINLDGVEGLVHLSEIAWQQVDSPHDYFTIGEEVKVLIKSVEIEEEKISLSRKAVLPNPWETFDTFYEEGSLIEGVVTNVVDFGAFVLVDKNIEGLLHVSEIRGPHGLEAHSVLAPGDHVLIRITNIDVERQRLGLSQRKVTQSEEMEWIWNQQQKA